VSEGEDESEFLLPIKEEAQADDAVVPPVDVPDDWLAQPDFDPAGRPI
jgi:hypothetical protein